MFLLRACDGKLTSHAVAKETLIDGNKKQFYLQICSRSVYDASSNKKCFY